MPGAMGNPYQNNGPYALVCNGKTVELSYEEMVNLVGFIALRGKQEQYGPGWRDSFNKPEFFTMLAKITTIVDDPTMIPLSEY